MKKVLKLVGILLLVLAIVVIGRTLLVPSKQIGAVPQTVEGIDAQRASRDLAGTIPFQTISWEGGGTPEQKERAEVAFKQMHAYLRKTFPLVFEKLRVEPVGEPSVILNWTGLNNILFIWKGSDPSLKPMLLMGHQDVVPIEAGTEGKWTHPPFSGEIADGYIWGRGTMDDKVTVVGVLEAVETLLAKGFQPKRTVYIAFGQDEEIGGLEGAEKIAQLLKSRGVELEFVQDEGGFISTGLVPGVRTPVAMIGTSEKGYLSLELTVDVPGGHSSVPPNESSIGILSAAIRKIETHPLPARIGGPMGEFLEYVGGSASFPMRIVFKNMWLFSPVVKKILEASPDSNATLRTTAAVTIFHAGTKDNVMPSHAMAVVNFRLLPGDTIGGVTEYVRKVVEDPRVKMQPMAGEPPSEASPQSRPDSANFKRMQRTVGEIYPEAVVAPFVFVGATDAKHYVGLTKDIYRFVPLLTQPEDLARFHGTNERIGVANFAKSIEFYCQLIRNAAG
jgi:carboxypeptidase PM20D1